MNNFNNLRFLLFLLLGQVVLKLFIRQNQLRKSVEYWKSVRELIDQDLRGGDDRTKQEKELE